MGDLDELQHRDVVSLEAPQLRSGREKKKPEGREREEGEETGGAGPRAAGLGEFVRVVLSVYSYFGGRQAKYLLSPPLAML